MTENVILNWESSDKFRPIQGRMLVEPATCAGCGKPPHYPDEPFISLLLELEYYGVVYLCLNCVQALGSAIGWIGPDKYQQLQQANQLLLARNSNLLQQVEYTRELLNVRINAGGPSKPDFDGSVGISILETESNSVDTNPELSGNEPEPVESSS